MKISAIYFSAFLVLSNAQDDDPMLRGKGRGGGRGGGRGKGKGGRGKGKNLFEKDVFSLMNGNCYWGEDNSRPLLERITEECNDYTCSENPRCDASWQNMVDEDFMVEGCPDEGLADKQMEDFKTKLQEKKEMWMNMSKEDRQELKEEKKAIKASNVATVLSLGCGCCGGSESGSALADIVRDKEGAVARTLGFRKPKGEGGGLLGQLGSAGEGGDLLGQLASGEGGGILGQLGSGEGGGILGQLGNGEGGGILGQLGNGEGGGILGQLGNGEGGGILGQLGNGGLGSGAFAEKLNEKCDGFKADNGCDTEEPDCTIFDTMTMKRDRKGGPIRKYMLRCGCCPREGGNR